MQKDYQDISRHLSRYDEHLCLKPSGLLWIAMVYLSRAIALPIVAQLASISGVSQETTSLVHGLFALDTILPSLPAAAVLAVAFLKSPSSGRTVRWIWAHGRAFLAVAALADVALTIFDAIWRHPRSQIGLTTVFIVGFDVYFALYVLSAKQVREVFASFPLPPPTPATRKRPSASNKTNN